MNPKLSWKPTPEDEITGFLAYENRLRASLLDPPLTSELLSDLDHKVLSVITTTTTPFTDPKNETFTLTLLQNEGKHSCVFTPFCNTKKAELASIVSKKLNLSREERQEELEKKEKVLTLLFLAHFDSIDLYQNNSSKPFCKIKIDHPKDIYLVKNAYDILTKNAPTSIDTRHTVKLVTKTANSNTMNCYYAPPQLLHYKSVTPMNMRKRLVAEALFTASTIDRIDAIKGDIRMSATKKSNPTGSFQDLTK